MQSIRTRYIPPSNTKPSRISATLENGRYRICVSTDSYFDWYEDHHRVCKMLQAKMAEFSDFWNAPMVGVEWKKEIYWRFA